MRTSIFLIFFFISNHTLAQSFTVNSDVNRIVYLGLENPITVVVEGYSCNDIFIKVDKGDIRKTDGCKYFYTSTATGKVNFTVSINKKSKKKKLGVYEFRVRKVQEPTAIVGNLQGGEISKIEFIIQKGVRLQMDPNVFVCTEGIPLNVDSYNFIIIRNNEVLKTVYNDSSQFTEATKQAMGLLQSGDKVIIGNISVASGIFQNAKFNPLEFTIKE